MIEKMKTHHKRYASVYIKLIVCLCFVFITTGFGHIAQCAAETPAESENSQIIEQQSDSADLKNIQNQLSKYSTGETKDILQDYDPQNIIKDAAAGKFELSLKSLADNVLRFFFKEIYINVGLMIKILVLIVICALLKNLQSSFLSESVGEIAFYVCYIVIVSILLVSFNTAIKMGISIIDNMVAFMYATIPVMITLLISGGNITSGGIFQPFMLLVVEISATVIRNVFLPLIFLSTILSIVNNISDKIQITRLTNLIKQITTWALGTILTVFIAVVSVQGSFGAVIDGITSKTAKFAISTFIPIVGKTLSDAADTVIGCTLLIKNAAGLAVMIGIIVICLVPLLKILALIALYKATCALVEPISEKRITNCISDIAGSMIYVFGVTAAVAFMFLISVTALISAGNLSAMIR